MTTFALEIWYNGCDECTFYSVRYDDCEDSEADKFFSKYEDGEYAESATMLLNFIIKTIGKYGALDIYFRDERRAKGLPPKNKGIFVEMGYNFIEYPLRLYALKVTEHIVILFNGGIKDAQTSQETSHSFQWREADIFAARIMDALQSGVIEVSSNNRTLKSHNGSSEIYL